MDDRLNSFWDEWYYILHDKDAYTEKDVEEWNIKNNGVCPFGIGELKKPHYHVIGCLKNPTILKCAAKKFGVSSNHVQKVGKLSKAIQYLVHRNNEEKYPYPVDEIRCKSRNLEKYFADNSSTEKAIMLIEVINSGQCNSLNALATFAVQNNCWDELRRGQHIFTALLNERRYGK